MAVAKGDTGHLAEVTAYAKLIVRRCHRLGKTCQPATFVRKVGSQKVGRKSQLEDKLDSLVTLLQVSVQIRCLSDEDY